MRRYVPRPVHFAFGKPGGDRADSPCGRYSMWHAGLAYTRQVEKVTCGHCLRWFRAQAKRDAAQQKANVIEGTAERVL